MPEHVHVHVPHELSEDRARPDPRRERTSRSWLRSSMSIATLGIVWSGVPGGAVERRPVASTTPKRARPAAVANRLGQGLARSGSRTSELQPLARAHRPGRHRSWPTSTSGASVTSSGPRSPRGSRRGSAAQRARGREPAAMPRVRARPTSARSDRLEAQGGELFEQGMTQPSTPTRTCSSPCSSPRCCSSPVCRCGSRWPTARRAIVLGFAVIAARLRLRPPRHPPDRLTAPDERSTGLAQDATSTSERSRCTSLR